MLARAIHVTKHLLVRIVKIGTRRCLTLVCNCLQALIVRFVVFFIFFVKLRDLDSHPCNCNYYYYYYYYYYYCDCYC